MQSYNNNFEFIQIILDYLFLDYWIKLYELLITFLYSEITSLSHIKRLEGEMLKFSFLGNSSPKYDLLLA